MLGNAWERSGLELGADGSRVGLIVVIVGVYDELVVVGAAPPKCRVAPHALNAARRAGLPAAAPPPAGGVPVGRVPVPLPGIWPGGVMPCFFRQFSSAVRLVVAPLVEAADDVVDVVFELLLELLPQAAIARLVTTAASNSISRNARRCLVAVDFTWGPFVVSGSAGGGGGTARVRATRG